MKGSWLAMLIVPLALSCGDERQRETAKADDRASSDDSLFAKGRALYSKSDYSGAQRVWHQSLERAARAGDATRQASAYTWLGLASYRLGDLDSSRAFQERAIEIKSRLPHPNDLWRSINALGLLVLDEARNDSAATLFEKALELATAADDSEGIAKATGNAALAYTYMGDLRRARAGHRAMRAAGQRIGDPRVEGNGLANEAMVDLWEGDASAGMTKLDTARLLYRRIGDNVGEQNSLGQLAIAQEIAGNPGAAFNLLDTALSIARRSSLREQTIETLRLLGGLHSRAGDHRPALKYYSEAEVLARSSGLNADLGSILRGAAQENLSLRNFARAKAQAREALQLHRDADEPLDIADDLMLLSRLSHEAGDEQGAKAYLDSASANAGASQRVYVAAVINIAHAAHADRHADSRAAIAALSRVDLASSRFDSEMKATAFAILTRAHLRQGDISSAVEAGASAVAGVERIRGTFGSETIRAAYSSARIDAYSDYMRALLLSGRTFDAFAVADRARSRALLEHMSGVEVGDHGDDRHFVHESERLLRRIGALSSALQSGEPAPTVERSPENASGTADILRKLADAETRYEQLIARTSGSSILTSTMKAVTLDGIRRALQPNELILEFFLGRDSVYAFAISSTRFAVTSTPLKLDAVAQRTRLLAELWGKRRSDWRLGLAPAARLYNDLVVPTEASGALSGIARVIIVPHGILSQVPFAALWNPVSRRYFVESYSITSAPSSRALIALRNRRTEKRQLPGVTGFAPLTAELPHTRVDLAAISRVSRRAESRHDEEATESSLRRSLQSGSVIHLATHGILNNRNPLFSRVDLARGQPAESRDDGRLEVRELLNLDVTSPLVFLAGCETGASEELARGETRASGDLAISQAMIAAGARNVVSALWRIDDAGAAAFSSVFYNRLARVDAGTALAGAQRALAAQTRYSNPYYWAGYVLSGEGTFSLARQKTGNLP